MWPREGFSLTLTCAVARSRHIGGHFIRLLVTRQHKQVRPLGYKGLKHQKQLAKM